MKTKCIVFISLFKAKVIILRRYTTPHDPHPHLTARLSEHGIGSQHEPTLVNYNTPDDLHWVELYDYAYASL